jgi:hypothetical protein
VNHLVLSALRTILQHPKNPESFAHAQRVLDYHDANPQPPGEIKMSLEANVAELNTNIKALIAAIAGAGVFAPSEPQPLSPAQDKAAAAAHIKAKAEKAEAKADPKEEPKVEAVDYEKHVKPAALKLASKKGRDALVGVYTAFGVSAIDAKPEQYAGLLAAINEALAA